MIFVLTYHKVVGTGHADEDFYTVQAADLERQLDMVADAGFVPLDPGELITGGFEAKKICLLTFDDGTRDHLDVVLPILERRGWHAVFFVSTSKLGRKGYLSGSELKQFRLAGHSIGCHSHLHRRMDRMARDELREQLGQSLGILERECGDRPVYFAPPGGYMNPEVCRAALDRGLRAIRTMRWGYNQSNNLTNLECVPVNRYVTEPEFARALSLRSRPWIYSMKETLKTLVPMRMYEGMRHLFFGTRRSG